jgi:hypothetical protein
MNRGDEMRGAAGAEGGGCGRGVPLPRLLGGLGERCKLPQWVRGKTPADFLFVHSKSFELVAELALTWHSFVECCVTSPLPLWAIEKIFCK